MTITVGNNAGTSNNSDSSSISWNHTIAAGDGRLLIVGVFSAGGLTGVTYNGVAMTIYPDALAFGAGAFLSTWFMLAPPVGTHQFVVSAGSAINLLAKSVDFSGTHSTFATAYDSATHSDAGATGTFSTSNTLATNGLLLDFIGTGVPAPTVASTNAAQAAVGAAVSNADAAIRSSSANAGTVMAWDLGITGAAQIVWSLRPPDEVGGTLAAAYYHYSQLLQ